jgi:hypothetical protein
MKKACRFLVLLYPRAHRDRFAAEMIQVFEEACAASRAQGWACYVRFVFAELRGLLGGAARAWLELELCPHSEIPAASALPKELVPLELLEAQLRVDATIAARSTPSRTISSKERAFSRTGNAKLARICAYCARNTAPPAPAPTIRAPTIRAPTIRAPTIRAPTIRDREGAVANLPPHSAPETSAAAPPRIAPPQAFPHA